MSDASDREPGVEDSTAASDDEETLRTPAASRAVAAAAVAYPLVVLLGGAGIVVVFARGRGSWLLVLAASALLGMAALVAAGCATHAILSKRWLWGVALLVGWPVSVPVYLWRLARPVLD